MSVFEEALRRTLFYEGGYSDDPHDPGGATKFGVSMRFLKGLGKLADFDHDGDVDQDDLLMVTSDPGKLSKLYFDNFWTPTGCPRIYSQHLQIKLFDTAVNAGPKRAQILLQRAHNICDRTSSILKEDGFLGAMSVASINALPDVALLLCMRGTQAQFYKSLIAQDATLSGFDLGWQRRAAT